MKVVFLDVDGVLNSYDYFSKFGKGFEWNILDKRIFDPATITRANKLSDLDVKFVLSSSWRGTDGFVKTLRQAGFRGELIGETPRVGRPRALEIAAYLRQEPTLKSFAILDDDSDMLHLKSRHVKTSYFQGGFQDSHLLQVLKILGFKK